MVMVGKSGGKRPSWFFRKLDGGMDWIDLAKDRDGWQVLINVINNLWVQ